MKKVIILLLLCFIGIRANAQYMFSTETYDYLVWVESDNKFKYVETNNNYASLFELNKNQTIIKHTTSDMTSNYYIRSKEYDEKYGCIKYDVVSDVGNEYIFIIDKENISILNLNANPQYCLKHYIKRIF